MATGFNSQVDFLKLHVKKTETDADNRGIVVTCKHCDKIYKLKDGWASPSSFIYHLKVEHELHYKRELQARQEVEAVKQPLVDTTSTRAALDERGLQ